jgi:hypothetical protein
MMVTNQTNLSHLLGLMENRDFRALHSLLLDVL